MSRPSLSAAQVAALDNRDARVWSVQLKLGFVFALVVDVAALVRLVLS